jgi:DNA-binding IscR family transcriptional regulator
MMDATEVAIAVVVEIARIQRQQAFHGKPPLPIPRAAVVAKFIDHPRSFEPYYTRLARAGILVGTPSRGGGYRLARPDNEITLAEIDAACRDAGALDAPRSDRPEAHDLARPDAHDLARHYLSLADGGRAEFLRAFTVASLSAQLSLRGAGAVSDKIADLREEVAFWRRDAAARLWAACASYRNPNASDADRLRIAVSQIMPMLAAFRDADAKHWFHSSCETCGAPIRAGEEYAVASVGDEGDAVGFCTKHAPDGVAKVIAPGTAQEIAHDIAEAKRLVDWHGGKKDQE